MSRQARDHYEAMSEAKEREYVAQALRIAPETLDQYPYDLRQETTNDGGIVTSWDLYWDDEAPDGVSTEGSEGSLWTSIAPDYSDDGDYEPEEE